ncbi:MAG: response regulator [Thermodesulfobacteriota bacterium]
MDTPAQWRIIFIDDEEDIRAVMAVTLEDAGYEVLTAADGEAGLDLCVRTRPQIVITDVRMPRMSGLAVLEAVKRLDPDTEVIVATAFGELDLAIKALQLDASDFITKPINDEALHLALKRARERHTSRRQVREYTALLEKEAARTAQELLKTINFQRNLIEGSMDGILGCDAEERVVVFNKSLERMLGYAKEEAIQALTLDRFLAAADLVRFREDLSAEAWGGPERLFLYETSLLTKSGQTVPVQVSATAWKTGGRPDGLVCFFRDLREIRRLEREMADQARVLHHDKMLSLGRLAASVAHEINNPLSGVLNFIRLMGRILKRGPLAEDQRQNFLRHLELVESETERCTRIVSGLLTFARKSPPLFGEVNVAELLNRCLVLSRHKLDLQNIRLEFSLDPDIPALEGDFNQLQQCVINLIFNAVDAMPEGGVLTLTGRHDRNRRLVSIAVTDTGPGIAPEHLPHVFEPFFTTKKEGYGVGLGLSTVFGIMNRHNAAVRVESQPGQGAAFVLELPVPAEEGQSQPV